MKRRPGGLTAICVLALVLGVMGLMSGLSDVLSWVSGTRLFSWMAASGSQGAWNATLTLLEVVASGALVAGGVLSLMLKSPGRQLLLGAFLAAVVHEGLCVPPSIQMQPDLEKQLASFFAAYSPRPGPQPQESDDSAELVGRWLANLTITVVVGMSTCRCVLFVIGLLYLRKRAVATLFETPPSSEPESR